MTSIASGPRHSTEHLSDVLSAWPGPRACRMLLWQQLEKDGHGRVLLVRNPAAIANRFQIPVQQRVDSAARRPAVTNQGLGIADGSSQRLHT